MSPLGNSYYVLFPKHNGDQIHQTGDTAEITPLSFLREDAYSGMLYLEKG
jgi:hypothetical protein